jgi:hypothetical protein
MASCARLGHLLSKSMLLHDWHDGALMVCLFWIGLDVWVALEMSCCFAL